MSHKRRTGAELSLSILICLYDRPRRLTYLLSECNLSFKLFSSYVDLLIENGLVEKIEETSNRDRSLKYRYHITDSGREVVNYGIRFYRALGIDMTERTKGIRRVGGLE